MELIYDFLHQVVEAEASDVHLKPGQPPIYRLEGHLSKADCEPLTAEDLNSFIHEILTDEMMAEYLQKKEIDFAWNFREDARFRVNLFCSGNDPTLALRFVKNQIPNFEQLHLPEVLKKISLTPRGIILLCGSTGSGKSTTLAAMVDHINTNEFRRIISIENPVEYLFLDKQCIISQREVGLDTPSFEIGFKNALRQDPDVIMIGEIRDKDSVATAMAAAETGHLILSTIHAENSPQAVSRILDMFPADERQQLRMVLANTLKGVISQRLVPDVNGRSRPAVEVMVSSPIVKKLIAEENLEALQTAIETGKEDGMQNFNQSLFEMAQAKIITEETALRFASNPESLRMNFRGIFLDNSRRIVGTSLKR